MMGDGAPLPNQADTAIVAAHARRAGGARMGQRSKMTDPKSRVVAIGEVMIELARGGDGRFGMACGGDTFNTAVYLARAGVDVSYATALGDDPYSDGIVSMAAA